MTFDDIKEKKIELMGKLLSYENSITKKVTIGRIIDIKPRWIRTTVANAKITQMVYYDEILTINGEAVK